MGRGRGWLHCAFSCSVSADGSWWAPCCIPLAPHHCLMARGQSILNQTPQLHGALPIPDHLALGPTSPIHLLSFPVPHQPLHGQAGCWRTSITFSSGGAWPAASACRVGCKATRLHPRRLLDASSASLQDNDKGRWKEALQLEDVALNGKSQTCEGVSNSPSHTACTWMSTHKWPQNHTWAFVSDTSPRSRRHCTIKLQPGVLTASLKDLLLWKQDLALELSFKLLSAWGCSGLQSKFRIIWAN